MAACRAAVSVIPVGESVAVPPKIGARSPPSCLAVRRDQRIEAELLNAGDLVRQDDFPAYRAFNHRAFGGPYIWLHAGSIVLA